MSGAEAAVSHVRTPGLVLVVFTASLLVPFVFNALRKALTSLQQRFCRCRGRQRTLKQRRATSPIDSGYRPWLAGSPVLTAEASQTSVALCEYGGCGSDLNGDGCARVSSIGDVQVATLLVFPEYDSCSVDAPRAQDSCSELSESSCDSFQTCLSRITPADHQAQENILRARLWLHAGDKDFSLSHGQSLISSPPTGFLYPANEDAAQARKLAFSEMAELHDEDPLCDCLQADDTRLWNAEQATVFGPENTLSYCVVQGKGQEIGQKGIDKDQAAEDRLPEDRLLPSRVNVKSTEALDASEDDPRVQKIRSFFNLNLQPGSVPFPPGCPEDNDLQREQSNDATTEVSVDPVYFSPRTISGRWPSPSRERATNRNELNSLQSFSLKQSISPHLFTIQGCDQEMMVATEGVDFCSRTQSDMSNPLASCGLQGLFQDRTEGTLLTQETRQPSSVSCPIECDTNVEPQSLQTVCAFCDMADFQAVIPAVKNIPTLVNSSHPSSLCLCCSLEPWHEQESPAADVEKQFYDTQVGQRQFERKGIQRSEGKTLFQLESECFDARDPSTDSIRTDEKSLSESDPHDPQEHPKTHEDVAIKAFPVDQSTELIRMDVRSLSDCDTREAGKHLTTGKDMETRASAAKSETYFNDVVNGSSQDKSEVSPGNAENVENEQQSSSESSSEVSIINARNVEDEQQSTSESSLEVSAEIPGNMEGEKQSNLQSSSEVSFTTAGNVEDEQQSTKESSSEVSIMNTENMEKEKQSILESRSEVSLPSAGKLGCVKQSDLEFSTDVSQANTGNDEVEQESSLGSRLELPLTNTQDKESEQQSTLKSRPEVAPVNFENAGSEQDSSSESSLEVSPGNSGNMEAEQGSDLKSSSELSPINMGNVESEKQSRLKSGSELSPANAEDMESKQQSILEPSSEPCPANARNLEGDQRRSLESNLQLFPISAGDVEGEQRICLESSSAVSPVNTGDTEGEHRSSLESSSDLSPTGAENAKGEQQSSLAFTLEVSLTNAGNLEVCPENSENMKSKLENNLESTSERYRPLSPNPTPFIHIPSPSTVLEVSQQSEALAAEHPVGMKAQSGRLNLPSHVRCNSNALGKYALRYLEYIEHHLFVSEMRSHGPGVSPFSNEAIASPAADTGAHSNDQGHSAGHQPDSHCGGEAAEPASGITPDQSSSQTERCTQKTDPGSAPSATSASSDVLNVPSKPLTVSEAFDELEVVIDTLLRLLNPADAGTQSGYPSLLKARPGDHNSHPDSVGNGVNMECSSEAAQVTKKVCGLPDEVCQISQNIL